MPERAPIRPVSARHAPRDRALPLVGRLLHIHRDLVSTLREIQARCGDVAWIRIGPIDVLALLSADGLELGLADRDHALSNRLGWERYLDHVFPGAILAMDGAEHRHHRRIMREAFSHAALAGYVAEMNPVIRDRVRAWGRQGPRLRAYPLVKQLTLDIATRVFMGRTPGPASRAINRAFVDAVDASIALLRLPVWPLPYYRGLRGRAFLARTFRGWVPGKRARRTPDLFSKLCFAQSEEGDRFTDEEVVDHMVFVMMAAHDTSTSTLSTAIYELARDSAWQERLRAESLARGELLSFAELEDLEAHTWVMNEALRLHPPLPVMPRVTVREVDFAGYRIPPGVLVGFAPVLVQRDPRWWSDPDAFDPERFSPARAEDRRHRYAFTPFGGGRHLCIGRRFGQLEIRATLHQMLRHYRWSVPAGYRMPYQHVPIAKPRDGLPIQLEPL